MWRWRGTRARISPSTNRRGAAMRTDEDIKRDVEYELKWDPDIDPSDIGVAVKDGAVTLSGFARSFRQRTKAAEDATRVRGVRESPTISRCGCLWLTSGLIRRSCARSLPN
ncbi:BON domain-containing protein [Paraburkholderia azotifigens]|uniref:BON domain-containing protein n=1 Tax=Paraburkholderia azotifigens TaxID=2057004 RepID=UPI003175E4F6